MIMMREGNEKPWKLGKGHCWSWWWQFSKNLICWATSEDENDDENDDAHNIVYGEDGTDNHDDGNGDDDVDDNGSDWDDDDDNIDGWWCK